MKRHTAIALIVVALLLAQACATLRPDQDPRLVRAQQLEASGFGLANTFVKFEYSQGAPIEASLPGIHGAANKVRQEGPKAIREVHRLIDLYASSKSSSMTDLDTALLLLDQLVNDIRAWNTRVVQRPTARAAKLTISVGDILALIQAGWEIYNGISSATQQAAAQSAAERAAVAAAEEAAFASPAWQVQ